MYTWPIQLLFVTYAVLVTALSLIAFCLFVLAILSLASLVLSSSVPACGLSGFPC